MKLTAFFLILAPIGLHASTVYSNVNPANDTGNSVFYSTGPYTEIGDSITLGGTERSAISASTQFFNDGTNEGTFDVSLRFFDLGSPVGTQIGNTMTVTGISIASFGTADVVFGNLGNLLLPDSLVFTLAVSNVTAGLDLAVNLFEPPTIGSSSNQFFIVSNATAYSQVSTGTLQDNVNFSLDAVAAGIPEPGTALLTLLGIPAIALLRRYRS